MLVGSELRLKAIDVLHGCIPKEVYEGLALDDFFLEDV